jgi:hypothetical protein
MVLEILSYQGPAAGETWCEYTWGHIEAFHWVFSETSMVAFLTGASCCCGDGCCAACLPSPTDLHKQHQRMNVDTAREDNIVTPRRLHWPHT